MQKSLNRWEYHKRKDSHSYWLFLLDANLTFILAIISKTTKFKVDQNQYIYIFQQFCSSLIPSHMFFIPVYFFLNAFSLLFQYQDFNYTKYPWLTKVVFAVFMILVPILLLNMLIAMMGNTYTQVINKSEKEWRKQVSLMPTILCFYIFLLVLIFVDWPKMKMFVDI